MGAGNGHASVDTGRRVTAALAYTYLEESAAAEPGSLLAQDRAQKAMRLVNKHAITDAELADVADDPDILRLVQRPKPRRAIDIVPDILAEASLPTITTGLANLDQLLGGGLRARTMTVLVAGSGRGKTSLAAFMAAHHAERHPVVYYSAELTPAQLVARVVAQRTQRSWRDVLTGSVPEDDMRRALSPLALYVFGRLSNPIATLAEAVDAAIREAEDGVPLLVVDYAQLVADVTADMRLSVMSAVRGIHQLTESRDVVTLLLAQGNRNSSRAMRAAEGSAVEYADAGGETAALEQSAATVIAVLYDPQDGATEHDVTLAVAKARYGATGKVGARFHGPSGAYQESNATPVSATVQARRKAIIAALHTTEPRSRNDVYRTVGGRRETVLATIQELIAEGVVIEHPGAALTFRGYVSFPGRFPVTREPTGTDPPPQLDLSTTSQNGGTQFRALSGGVEGGLGGGAGSGSVPDLEEKEGTVLLPDSERARGRGARGTAAPPVPASAAPSGGRPEPAPSEGGGQP